MRSVESQTTSVIHFRLLPSALLLISSQVWAATFSVTRSDDPIPGACQMMDCSLREAVLAANALPGADTIMLQAVTYELSQPGTDDFNLVGDLDILETVTVVGVPGFGSPPPVPLTTVDANGIDRVFEVLSGAVLTLQAINVTGGGSVSDGGGIQVSGLGSGMNSRLVLQNSHVFSNTSTGLGGGIASPDASTILVEQNSAIRDNSAFVGGGIRKVFGQVVVKDSSVSNNAVVNGGLGAGISLISASLVATNALIDLNSNANNGGGIHATNSDLTLIGSTVRNNTAINSGGGLYLDAASNVAVAEIRNSVFHGNTALTDGGGAYVDGDMHLINSTFSGNTAVNGGGVFLTLDGAMSTEHATIANNSATSGEVLFVEDGPMRATAVTWLNTILKGDCMLHGTFVDSLGGNLESTSDTCGLGAGVNDQVSVVTFQLLLLSLADNGGPTLTHAISVNSVARDNAVCNEACIVKDQRFFNRGSGPVDSGAFENGPIFSDSFESL